jgi:N-acetylglucosamine kinase-like BadF-type ATPase
MPQYFLGVDIGASKSHALIADETGRVAGFGHDGPGNHEVVGYSGLVRVLKSVTGQALERAGLSRDGLAGAGFGIAGYDWPAERERTRRAIEMLGLAAPFEFVNDTVLGLLAGTAEGWGVAVVAGTSNNCRGRDRHGREGRVTGAGPAMGEYGGAGELVARAVQAVSRAWSRRGPATRLTHAFVELTGASDADDLLEGLALGRYQVSAAAAPLVFRSAEAGDRVAQELISWAGCELGSLAAGVIRQLELEALDFEVVLVGSLFKGSLALVEALRSAVQAVAPGARLVRLAAPPVVGGVLLGMQQAGLDARPVRPALVQNAAALHTP